MIDVINNLKANAYGKSVCVLADDLEINTYVHKSFIELTRYCFVFSLLFCKVIMII